MEEGSSVVSTVQGYAKPGVDLVAKYPGWVFIILLLIVLYLIYSMFFASESWTAGPTATLGYQQNDWGLGGSGMESMDSTDPNAPAVATTTDPNSPQFPGSPSWTVLNSPDFACDTRTAATDNAWGWQYQQAMGPDQSTPSTTESFDAYGRPTSPGDLTQLLAGRAN